MDKAHEDVHVEQIEPFPAGKYILCGLSTVGVVPKGLINLTASSKKGFYRATAGAVSVSFWYSGLYSNEGHTDGDMHEYRYHIGLIPDDDGCVVKWPTNRRVVLPANATLDVVDGKVRVQCVGGTVDAQMMDVRVPKRRGVRHEASAVDLLLMDEEGWSRADYDFCSGELEGTLVRGDWLAFGCQARAYASVVIVGDTLHCFKQLPEFGKLPKTPDARFKMSITVTGS